jgi:hypothetical protein
MVVNKIITETAVTTTMMGKTVSLLVNFVGDRKAISSDRLKGASYLQKEKEKAEKALRLNSC